MEMHSRSNEVLHSGRLLRVGRQNAKAGREDGPSGLIVYTKFGGELELGRKKGRPKLVGQPLVNI
jgi:hypothetical protein